MPPKLKAAPQSVIANGKKQITSLYDDETEVYEEFDVVTDELLLRQSRKTPAIGGEGPWTTEVGRDTRRFNPDRDLLVEANDQPVLSRADDKEFVIFRIRNLPYPKDVFSVTVDAPANAAGGGSGEIVVRTSNKKYFKRIPVPDMARAGIALDAANLQFDHAHNTLDIKYKKPLSMLALEGQTKRERATMVSKRVKEGGEEQCAQQ